MCVFPTFIRSKSVCRGICPYIIFVVDINGGLTAHLHTRTLTRIRAPNYYLITNNNCNNINNIDHSRVTRRIQCSNSKCETQLEEECIYEIKIFILFFVSCIRLFELILFFSSELHSAVCRMRAPSA